MGPHPGYAVEPPLMLTVSEGSIPGAKAVSGYGRRTPVPGACLWGSGGQDRWPLPTLHGLGTHRGSARVPFRGAAQRIQLLRVAAGLPQAAGGLVPSFRPAPVSSGPLGTSLGLCC